MNEHRNPAAKQVGQLVLSPSQYFDSSKKGSNPFFGKSGDVFMSFDGQQDSHTTKCWLNPKDDADMGSFQDWLDWGMKNLSSIKVGFYEPADPTRQSQPSQYQQNDDFQQAYQSNDSKRSWQKK